MMWLRALSTVTSSGPARGEVRVTPIRCAVVIETAGWNLPACVPDPPGCVATGAALPEAEAAIREAIEFRKDGLREDGSPVAAPSSKEEYAGVAA